MRIKTADNIFTLIDKFNFKNHTVFNDLTEEEKNLLETNMVTIKYKKHQVLFHEGGYPSGVYILREGTVKKYKSSENGKEIIIYFCRPGEILGYHALLCEESYSDTAATVEECIISFIPREDFLKIIDQSSSLSRKLLRSLSHEFGVLMNGIMIHANKSVRERIALAMVILHYKFKDDSGNSSIRLSRDDIANYVGTAKENLIRILHELKEDKIIKTDRTSITVIDISRLIHNIRFY